MSNAQDDSKKRKHDDVPGTKKGRFQLKLSGLPPIFSFEEWLGTGRQLVGIRNGLVSPSVLPTPALVDGFEYSGKGDNPDFTFEGDQISGRSLEVLLVKHYMANRGYDYAIKFSDGYLYYRNVRVALGFVYNGSSREKVFNAERIASTDATLKLVLQQTADVTLAIFNNCQTILGTVKKFNETDAKTFEGILASLDGVELAGWVAILQAVKEDQNTPGILKRVLVHLIGLTTPTLSLDAVFAIGEGFSGTELAGILSMHPAWAAPLTVNSTKMFVDEDGTAFESSSLESLADDGVVHCMSAHLHVQAIQRLRLSTPVYPATKSIFRTVSKKKTKQRGVQVETTPISVRHLKALARKNSDAPVTAVTSARVEVGTVAKTTELVDFLE